MDYVFVLDASGSMAHNGKLILSRDSVLAFVDALGPEDRFDILTFNVTSVPLFGELRDVGDSSRTAAATFLASQQAKGGTVLQPALETAFRYVDSDRPLQVVILSDGMTEQRERATLLRMSQAAPAGARIFCIGVGNDVNRPLLEELAEDSGGLAAFVSTGDNVTRQAEAFRRKLTRPVLADVTLDFGDLRVTDLTPEAIPNLYHGQPVRVYGRYKKGGDATITVSGTVRGMAVRQAATLSFSDDDPNNPEIERMWAWHRVDVLQKAADRSGTREQVIDEIVELGETYSIVTEYTSFLVLENDAEYQRWKIDRRNARRMADDRRAQAQRRDILDAIRSRVAKDIGPGASVAEPEPMILAKAIPPTSSATAPQQIRTPSTASSRSRPSSPQSIDFDFGTGPVGPAFLLFSAWVARRRRRA
ncbi:MAG: VWA domain-containing protein [Verrucomicrobia bacterium]|nr:VWA domain-containing protein [Verrucomicrobiota bacterium]